MRESFFKLLREYLNQGLQAVAGVDFYEEAVSEIEADRDKNVQPIYDELVKQLKDKELMKAMSIPEKHALGKNEINFKHALQEMNNTLSHLMQSKWSRNTHMSMWLLEDVKMLLDHIISGADYELTDIGNEIKAKELLSVKKFQKSDYVGKIASCQTLLTTVADLFNDGNPGESDDLASIKFQVRTGIGKAIQCLQYEIEDREANGAPEVPKFQIPAIVEPEVPEAAPEPQMEVVQGADENFGAGDAPDPVEAPADAEQLEMELK